MTSHPNVYSYMLKSKTWRKEITIMIKEIIIKTLIRSDIYSCRWCQHWNLKKMTRHMFRPYLTSCLWLCHFFLLFLISIVISDVFFFLNFSLNVFDFNTWHCCYTRRCEQVLKKIIKCRALKIIILGRGTRMGILGLIILGE